MSGQGSPNRSSLGTFLTRALNAFGRISAVGAAHGLYPSEEFRGMLERERSLADRHGRYFSLITFSREGIEGWANDGKVVARILTSRLRTTDVAGWMEGRRIGVILPLTSGRGAVKVAEDIVGKAGFVGEGISFSIYTYPADVKDDGNAPAGRRRNDVQASTGAATSDSVGASAASEAVQRSEPSREPAMLRSREGIESSDHACAIHEILAPPFPFWKRALDVLIASAGLIILSPLLFLTALLIKAVSPGPVIFKQERVGRLGRKFYCWKFRTMHMGADPVVHQHHFDSLMQTDVPMTKLDRRNDSRVIPFGKVIRASGIDELPQLYNVLCGDMSFVGPRPCIEYEYNNYLGWQKRRFDARPGLTGLWQVSGKNRTTFTEMMRLDISYGRRPSIWKDVRIVLRTPPAVVREVRDILNAGRGDGP